MRYIIGGSYILLGVVCVVGAPEIEDRTLASVSISLLGVLLLILGMLYVV